MPQHRWAFERGILYATDMQVRPVASRLEAVFQELGREKAEPLAEAMGLPDSKALLTRFATGRRCFSAWVEGRIAAYGWVSRAAECIGEQEREIRMSPGEMYIWDCATRPEYRGQRLYSALLSHMITALRGEGVRRLWIGTSLANRPSLRGFVNAGFVPVLTLVYIRLLSVHWVVEIGDGGAKRELVSAARRAVTMEHEHILGPIVVGKSQPALPAPCAEMEA